MAAFQAAAGLDPDSIVGPMTWAALIVPVSTGSSGEAILAAQGQLRSQGWRLAVDGDFGPITEETVRDFQVARCLAPGGAVGAVTSHTLVADFLRLPTPEESAPTSAAPRPPGTAVWP